MGHVPGFARQGDVIVVQTLNRLGRTMRDTSNLIHELTGRERGVWVRNLADPIKVDSADPADPIGQLAVVRLGLFAQTERTYTCERAAHGRARPAHSSGLLVTRPYAKRGPLAVVGSVRARWQAPTTVAVARPDPCRLATSHHCARHPRIARLWDVLGSCRRARCLADDRS